MLWRGDLSPLVKVKLYVNPFCREKVCKKAIEIGKIVRYIFARGYKHFVGDRLELHNFYGFREVFLRKRERSCMILHLTFKGLAVGVHILVKGKFVYY